jgi:hypothetical protein
MTLCVSEFLPPHHGLSYFGVVLHPTLLFSAVRACYTDLALTAGSLLPSSEFPQTFFPQQLGSIFHSLVLKLHFETSSLLGQHAGLHVHLDEEFALESRTHS